MPNRRESGKVLMKGVSEKRKLTTGGFSSVKRQHEEKEQKLSVLEESFASVQKEVTELRSCLREVERSRLEARRELQELRRKVCHPCLPLQV